MCTGKPMPEDIKHILEICLNLSFTEAFDGHCVLMAFLSSFIPLSFGRGIGAANGKGAFVGRYCHVRPRAVLASQILTAGASSSVVLNLLYPFKHSFLLFAFARLRDTFWKNCPTWSTGLHLESTRGFSLQPLLECFNWRRRWCWWKTRSCKSEIYVMSKCEMMVGLLLLMCRSRLGVHLWAAGCVSFKDCASPNTHCN